MEKCNQCPVKCGLCVAQKANHQAFCKRIERDPSYANTINHLSCNEELKQAIVTVTEKEIETISEKKEYPGVIQMGANLLSSAGKFVKSGFAMANDETYDRRLNICNNCPTNDLNKEQGRCFACGCFVKAKARGAAEKCPKGHWEKSDEELAAEKTEKEKASLELQSLTFSSIIHPCGGCEH